MAEETWLSTATSLKDILNIKDGVPAATLNRFSDLVAEGSPVFILFHIPCEVLVLAQVSVQQLMLLALQQSIVQGNS